MVDHPSFFENPEGTQEVIMKATYQALREHGYADLSIQRIADHFGKSKSLLYHHYDSKDDLLLEFLAFMLDEFEDSVPHEAVDGADDHLDAILDAMFAANLPQERREFTKAMVELRAQATRDERYREQFTRHDEFFHDRLADVVREGVERGTFDDVDPDAFADFLLTTITGAMTRRATTADADDAVAATRTEIDRYVDVHLRGNGDG